MILGLDIDGVVADFLSPFLLRLEKKVGNGPIPAETITDFTFKEHPFLSEEVVWDCMHQVSQDPLFWQSQSSLISPAEWRGLEQLSRRRRLVFITHRHRRGTDDLRGVTRDWLRTQGIREPVVHFTQEDKGALVRDLAIDLFVDDRYENCRDVAENTEAVVLMPGRPYNRSFDHPRVRRIQSFSEVFDHLP